MNELELEKQNLVILLNEINKKIDEFDIDELWISWKYFKDICTQKQKILDRIKFINNQLKCED